MGIFTANREISSDTLLQRKSDLLFNKIDDEIVILSLEKNEYFGLDKVGSRIWELLEQPIFFNRLVAQLTDEYEVTEHQCKEDTLTFLTKMADKKLIITA
jgi:hypothetical protein